MTLDAALQALAGFQRFGLRPGLDTTRTLAARAGNPEATLRFIHVAGTNGKGSTCAFLRASLEAAGKTVHVYTSPHLIRFNERIRVAGQLIDDATLARVRAAFEAHVRPDGANFTVPVHVRLLRRGH